MPGKGKVDSGLEPLRYTREGILPFHIYFSIEEFKGLVEVRRGQTGFRVTPGMFNNPLAPSGIVASSGASRSQGILTTISLGNHRMGAEHLGIALAAYGLEEAAMAVWLPVAHGAALWAVLALAVLGRAPDRWFAQAPGWFAHDRRPHASNLATVLAARLHGIRWPRLQHVPIGQESSILEWTVGAAAHRCGFLTTPSMALRLSLAAKRRGVDLNTVVFITLAEPLTPTKFDIIREQARAPIPRWGSLSSAGPRMDVPRPRHLTTPTFAPTPLR